MKALLFILSLIWLTACHTVHKVASSDVSTKEQSTLMYTRTDKLTPVAMPVDSSKLSALFRCDSLNNVLMVELIETKTKGFESKFNFKDGALNYQTATGGDTVYIPGSETMVYTDRNILKTNTKTLTITKTIVKKVPVKVYVHDVFWYTGVVFYGILLFIIINKLNKKIKSWQLIKD